jgi:uncharacterized protein YcbK (DUF882 family)
MANTWQQRSDLWSRPTRRGVLAGLVGLVVAGGASSPALSVPLTVVGDGTDAATEPDGGGSGARRIALRSLNTGERVDAAYWQDGRYDAAAVAQLDAVMRDWRNDEVGQIDPTLYDMLWAIGLAIGEDPEFTVLCGYRSPSTNAMLISNGTSGIAGHSMHVEGRAADITIGGASLRTLRDTAKALHAGGVGYYPRSGFVHVDTGDVRTW